MIFKKTLLLLLVLLGAIVVKAQDELIATKYSNDGKSFHSLKQPISILFDNTKIGKTEFKILKANKLELNGYLDEFTVVKSSIVKNALIEVRRVIASERGNAHIKHEFSLTTILDKNTKIPQSFSIARIRNKKPYIYYEGKM